MKARPIYLPINQVVDFEPVLGGYYFGPLRSL
jgi:hypothetical protein